MSAISTEKKPKGILDTMQLQDYSNVHPVCPTLTASSPFANQL